MSELLVPDNPGNPHADIRLVRRAVKERWPVPDDLQQVVIERLGKIARKESVTVYTENGPIQVEGPADSNAVRAAAVLAQMTAQNQADDHLADKNARIDAGLATERTAVEPVILRRAILPPAEG